MSERSTNPVRGGGSASATTISSWSALATTTRSVGSVSSAVRRNTVRRSPRRTMRASASGRPDRSPTRPTSSPTTIGVRPNSRARIAVTTRSGSRAERTAPSAPIDRRRPSRSGRRRARVVSWSAAASPVPAAPGRRTRRSRRGLKLPALQHVRPHPREVGQRLGGGADVLDLDAGHRAARRSRPPSPSGGRRRTRHDPRAAAAP